MFAKIYDLLGSKKITVFASIISSIFIILLIIFAVLGTPRQRLADISTMLPYKLLYVLLLVNTFVCILKTVPRAIRQSKFTKEDIQSIKNIKSRKNAIEFVRENMDFKKIAEPFKPLILSSGSSSAYCFKNRFALLWSVFFHISFFFIAFGVLLSNQTRFVGEFTAVEGFEFTGERKEYTDIYPEEHGFLKSGELLEFKIKQAYAKFWKDRLLFTDLAYEIEYDGGKKATIRMNKPVKIKDKSVYVLGYNYAPEYKIHDKEGVLIEQSTVQLAGFPPGTVDSFNVLSSDYKIDVAIFPEYKKTGSELKNTGFFRKNPGYLIRIYDSKNKKTIFNGFAKEKEKIKFGNYLLSFPKLWIHGQFRAIRDKGLVFVWLGAIIGCLSVVVRIIFCQKKIWIAIEHSGSETKVYLYGQSEFFPGLFQIKLAKLAERLQKINDRAPAFDK